RGHHLLQRQGREEEGVSPHSPPSSRRKRGTHSHRWSLMRDGGTTSPFNSIGRGVWVPAFAGRRVEQAVHLRTIHSSAPARPGYPVRLGRSVHTPPAVD